MSTPVKPLGPTSDRGREVRADLTLALDDVEQAVAERRGAEKRKAREAA